jgi:prepilin-type N-terminal cleavage/methylation domain-containing protein
MPKSAFTLIEMLVVLVILAILTSLAFGTLGVVRKLAESTNCLTNLSQMPFASIAYTQENRFCGRLPPLPRGSKGKCLACESHFPCLFQ